MLKMDTIKCLSKSASIKICEINVNVSRVFVASFLLLCYHECFLALMRFSAS